MARKQPTPVNVYQGDTQYQGTHAGLAALVKLALADDDVDARGFARMLVTPDETVMYSLSGEWRGSYSLN